MAYDPSKFDPNTVIPVPANMRPPVKSMDTSAGDSEEGFYICIGNSSTTHHLHVRISYFNGGISNFTLQPKTSHRTYVGDGEGVLCWKWEPIVGKECPNSTPLLIWKCT